MKVGQIFQGTNSADIVDFCVTKPEFFEKGRLSTHTKANIDLIIAKRKNFEVR